MEPLTLKKRKNYAVILVDIENCIMLLQPGFQSIDINRRSRYKFLDIL